MDSQIDMPIPRSDVSMESSPPHEMNLSTINPPSTGIHGIALVRRQNLYGSEPNIDRVYEGGNVRLIGVPLNRTIEVRNQNLYGSESSIDRLYEGGNPRSIAILQNRIIEVRDQTLHGSTSNLNHNYESGNEMTLSKQTSKNARVGDQNLYGSRSGVDLIYEGGNLQPVAMPLGRSQTLLSSSRNNDQWILILRMFEVRLIIKTCMVIDLPETI